MPWWFHLGQRVPQLNSKGLLHCWSAHQFLRYGNLFFSAGRASDCYTRTKECRSVLEWLRLLSEPQFTRLAFTQEFLSLKSRFTQVFPSIRTLVSTASTTRTEPQAYYNHFQRKDSITDATDQRLATTNCQLLRRTAAQQRLRSSSKFRGIKPPLIYSGFLSLCFVHTTEISTR
ncbi:hypothetical protein AC578_4102 [Pseudocercospora eumusae]|uniref:Uncharacterized protein n=1 Tax=Pseudocercospora eumusae TaxID=321146 RepID=A0A139HDF1_9PEZI|nr:hypothetical protein AC578_4102 [Pseudocercospora eumusae]